MVIRGRAPLRISFEGGSTDVALSCEEQGGAIVGSTINKYVYCSIIPREDDQIMVYSMDFDMIMKYNTSENYVYNGELGLVTAALNAMGIDQGHEAYLQCNVPPDSGFGTSSTVMVVMFTAMAHWRGMMIDTYTLVGLACQVEYLDLKISRGCQDQHAVIFGGFSFVEFHGRNNVMVNPLCIKKDIIHELQYNLPLYYTGKIHVSANIIRDQVQNYEKRDVFEATCEIKALAYALKDGLLKGNLHSFSKLLDYGWQSKKRMSSKITSPQIDQLYDEVLEADALGDKFLEAGGGGYLLMYCPHNVRHKVTAHMEQAGGQLADWDSELRGAQSWVADGSRWQYDQVKAHVSNDEYRFNI